MSIDRQDIVCFLNRHIKDVISSNPVKFDPNTSKVTVLENGIERSATLSFSEATRIKDKYGIGDLCKYIDFEMMNFEKNEKMDFFEYENDKRFADFTSGLGTKIHYLTFESLDKIEKEVKFIAKNRELATQSWFEQQYQSRKVQF